MNKCYLGSKNKAKIAAVKEVLNDYEVIALDVDSGVNKQPLSDSETIQGATFRALALPKGGIRIGLEAGVQLHADKLFLVNWGVLLDDKGKFYYAGGTRIPLPEFIKKRILNDDLELAEVMDEYLNEDDIRSRDGAIGYFTASLVNRKDIFVHIVKLLYGQYRKELNI
ncbi:MAG: DUF84 family protein [Bacilli bacterium]|nr:DUF84 family protein [Bacilli bacterium]